MRLKYILIQDELAQLSEGILNRHVGLQMAEEKHHNLEREFSER